MSREREGDNDRRRARYKRSRGVRDGTRPSPLSYPVISEADGDSADFTMRIPRVGVTQDRLPSCDVRVQLTHVAEEFGRVGLQLDGARGVCGKTLRYRGQDRKGIAFDLLKLHLGDIYRQIDRLGRPQITVTGTIIEYFIKLSAQDRQAARQSSAIAPCDCIAAATVARSAPFSASMLNMSAKALCSIVCDCSQPRLGPSIASSSHRSTCSMGADARRVDVPGSVMETAENTHFTKQAAA